MDSNIKPADERTVIAAMEVLQGESKKPFWARIMPFLGPAFIAAVAYVDPGNFATNIQGGSQFGYQLVWVIVASNLMAMLIQSLSAKLGIATGKNLAELCRDHFPRPMVWVMWVLMEVVAISTDLAEFLGAALGFNLLFHIPLIWGGVLTGIVTFAALALERYGFRPVEALIAALVGVVALAYVLETLIDRPDWAALAHGALVPSFSGTESVLLAAGILGATVMPHVIFLHSGLTQGRIATREPEQLKRLFRFEVVDVIIAMGVAGAVNTAMLVMAAATFHKAGMTGVGSIEEAHLTLQPLLGKASSVIFGISLLASGLSSTMVGTMSGQMIMQGFLHREIPLWLRRGVTMAPSFLVILMGWDPTRRRDLMGELANGRLTNLLAGMVAVLIVALNIYLLYQTFQGG